MSIKLKDTIYDLINNSDKLDGKHASDFSLASHTHNYAGSSSAGGVAIGAEKLTTVSKTAWGQTYWTSTGVPTSISGAMTDVSSITFNNGVNSIIYNSKGKAILHAAPEYTILGYGSCGDGKDTYIDGNNIRFRYGTSWTEGMKLDNQGNLNINKRIYLKRDYDEYLSYYLGSLYGGNTDQKCTFVISNTSGAGGILFETYGDGTNNYFPMYAYRGKVSIGSWANPLYTLHTYGTTYSTSHIGTGGNLFVSQTDGAGAGLSLYSSQSFVQNYGIWCGSGSTFGTIGDCTTGDWHMYFGMDGSATTRGWIFRHNTNGPVASICADGNFTSKGWYRTKGNGGWYSTDYGGGWHMTDTTWIRNYNNKPLYININTNNTYGIGGHRLASVFYGTNHVSILLSNNKCGWGVCSNQDTNLYFGYRDNSSLTSTTGDCYPIHITSSGYIHATYFTGHANSATLLYASGSPYEWNGTAPHYMRMRYNVNSDNRWYLSVYPETPKEVSVNWSYGSDSVDGYHISVVSVLPSSPGSTTIYYIV